MTNNNQKSEQQRWELNRQLKDMDEMAKMKIKTLELELKQQGDFFKTTE